MRVAVSLAIATLAWAGGARAAEGPNGFSLANARVPAAQIVPGGPPRDGIPSVDAPRFAAAAEARWVEAPNPTLGVAIGDDARAYPVHVIERHQVVNDRFGELPVAVTYDPLAGSPRAYEARAGGRSLRFGVSGLIYNHNFLLYDRETESLWVQFTGEAIAGPLAGRRLAPLPIRREAFAVWREQHPRTRVLALPKPGEIDYSRSPYLAYVVDDRAIFPVLHEDRRFHLKEMALGVLAGGRERVYLGSLMTAAGGKAEDTIAGRRVKITYDPGEAVFTYEAPGDVRVEEAYWLGWKAFHPKTEVWHDSGADALPDQGSSSSAP